MPEARCLVEGGNALPVTVQSLYLLVYHVVWHCAPCEKSVKYSAATCWALADISIIDCLACMDGIEVQKCGGLSCQLQAGLEDPRMISQLSALVEPEYCLDCLTFWLVRGISGQLCTKSRASLGMGFEW